MAHLKNKIFLTANGNIFAFDAATQIGAFFGPNGDFFRLSSPGETEEFCSKMPEITFMDSLAPSLETPKYWSLLWETTERLIEEDGEMPFSACNKYFGRLTRAGWKFCKLTIHSSVSSREFFDQLLDRYTTTTEGVEFVFVPVITIYGADMLIRLRSERDSAVLDTIATHCSLHDAMSAVDSTLHVIEGRIYNVLSEETVGRRSSRLKEIGIVNPEDVEKRSFGLSRERTS